MAGGSDFRDSRSRRREQRAWRLVAGLFAVFAWIAGARVASAAQTIRVVAYNIDADVNGNAAPNAGLFTALEAIGENLVNGAAHPLDVIALEETTSNTATVAPIVTALNNDYAGAATYAASPYQATQYGAPTVGNGPNAMIYNSATLTLLTSVGVGTPKGVSNGEYRQVARYEFLPVGGPAATHFYVYVTHMKSSASGTTAAVQKARNQEATIIRNDIATLPANGGVLAVGDFNMDGSIEAGYQTLTAGGAAQLLDPLNPSLDYNQTWDTAAYLSLMTESVSTLSYRDDIQFMSSAVYNGALANGLHYVAGSCVPFGNNGTIRLHGKVTDASNTALNGLQGKPIDTAAARKALSTASDHFPVVADYTVSIAPGYAAWQARYFTSAELADATVSGTDADPDGDGIPNLLEYALNLPPRTAGTVGMPKVGTTVVGGGTYLTLTYTKVLADTDISYVPQVGGDLATWKSDAASVAIVSATNNLDGLTQTVVARDLTPLTAGTRRFIRLGVTIP